MAEYKFGSIVDRNFRLTLQRLADEVNAHGKTIQDLVAEGQLTPTQYLELLRVVNGLLKSGDVGKNDLKSSLKNEIENKRDKGNITLNDIDDELLAAIQGGLETSFNLLSIPRDGSVTPEKTTFLQGGKNLFNKDDVVANRSINTSTGQETNSEYYDLYKLSVNPNENYTQNLSFVVAEYDENGVFNPQTLLPYVKGYNVPRTMTTSSTASYVKIAVLKEELSNFQFERGTEFTGYEEYGLKLKNVTTDFSEMLTQQNEEWVV